MPKGTLRMKQEVKGDIVEYYIRYGYDPIKGFLRFNMIFLTPPYDVLPELLPREICHLTAVAILRRLRDEGVTLHEYVGYRGSRLYGEIKSKQ
ncbi:MAG: hypothetical protein HYS80_00330 [Candidatus Aenigmarchaeota archaeon]|nr:hypothetical protein [Candidatus Aenigmarchaeota archaeon]